MAYGRKSIPPPATPFEEFMATASEKMIAAKIDFIEFLRELPPAASESKPPPMSRAKSVRKAAAKITGMSGAFSGKKKADAVPKAEKAAAANAKGRATVADKVEAAPAPASTTEKVVAKVEETTDKAEAAAAAKVDEAAAAAKAEAKDKIDEAAGKLGVDAPPVSMEAIDQAAELTKGKVAEGGAATDDAVKKAVVGPAQ